MRLRFCAECGAKLTGKQTLYCSPAHANAAWVREHAEERAAAKRAYRAGRKPVTIEDSLRQRVSDLEAELAQLRATAREAEKEEQT